MEDLAVAAEKVAGLMRLLTTTGGLRLKYRITAGAGAADPDGFERRDIYVECKGPDSRSPPRPAMASCSAPSSTSPPRSSASSPRITTASPSTPTATRQSAPRPPRRRRRRHRRSRRHRRALPLPAHELPRAPHAPHVPQGVRPADRQLRRRPPPLRRPLPRGLPHPSRALLRPLTAAATPAAEAPPAAPPPTATSRTHRCSPCRSFAVILRRSRRIHVFSPFFRPSEIAYAHRPHPPPRALPPTEFVRHFLTPHPTPVQNPGRPIAAIHAVLDHPPTSPPGFTRPLNHASVGSWENHLPNSTRPPPLPAYGLRSNPLFGNPVPTLHPASMRIHPPYPLFHPQRLLLLEISILSLCFLEAFSPPAFSLLITHALATATRSPSPSRSTQHLTRCPLKFTGCYASHDTPPTT